MKAIQYVRSIPRYLTVRTFGRRWAGATTSRFSCVRFTELAPPELPGPEWARVRPLLSGICGSDLATIAARGTPYFSPFTSTPFVFGHEIVGVVEAVGGAVRNVAVGDRVVLEPPLHCRVRGIAEPCSACRAGHTGHCLRVTEGTIAAGIQTGYCTDTGGGWSNSLIAHDLQLHVVPTGLGDRAAVLIEPFSCCLHAVEVARPSDDACVLVIGAGTIGVLTVAAIRGTGSRCRIVVVARHAHQQAAADALGADHVLPPGTRADPALAEQLGVSLHKPEIGPAVGLGGADITFDCVGSGRTLDDAMRFTRARGMVVVVGMPGLARGIDWTAMWHKELTIRGSYTCERPTFERSIELVHEMEERLTPLVGATFPLDRYREAIAFAAATGRSGVVKTVFEPSTGQC